MSEAEEHWREAAARWRHAATAEADGNESLARWYRDGARESEALARAAEEHRRRQRRRRSGMER